MKLKSPKFIGTINGTHFTVSDPCYFDLPDNNPIPLSDLTVSILTNLQHHALDIYAIDSVEPSEFSGQHFFAIIACEHSANPGSLENYGEITGNAPVDSGQLSITITGQSLDYDRACNISLSPNGRGMVDGAFVTLTREGDGSYPVSVRRNDQGNIDGFCIRLHYPGDDAEPDATEIE